ncbi:non structural polyprotein [Biomphalaria virus 1]|uniref:non structural polyprotein n=1 Tax=Biomphalaria virus 1 TaxID=1931369 RepID=UPI0009505A7E|nr:non structural polyprotein [Biomphalaria virus 1]APS85747.1 non structural polyprotein [Biomphalaria virus 1]
MAGFAKSLAAASGAPSLVADVREILPEVRSLVSELRATTITVADASAKSAVDVSETLNAIRDQIERLATPAARAAENLTAGSAKVDEILGFVKSLLEEKTLSQRIVTNATKHIIGISASVVSLMNAKSCGDVLASSVSIMSMLGMESELALKIISRFASSGDEEAVEIEQQGVDFAKIGELLTCLTGLAGKDSFVPSCVLSWIKSASSAVANANALKKMWAIIEDILAEMGFDVTERLRNLRILKDKFEAVRKDAEEIEARFNISAADFLKATHAASFQRHYDAVMELEKVIMSKSISDQLSRATINSVMGLVTQVKAQKQKLVVLQASCSVRPCPVGVALIGPSSIGKSALQNHLVKLVQQNLVHYSRISPDAAFAEDAATWVSWCQNPADAYDQGYANQEIHLVDDAFQNADDADHLGFIQKISTTPALTYQASLTDKGMPYRSRLVMVSCNVFPQTSKTLTTPAALSNRFPVKVECQLATDANGVRVPPPGRDAQNFDPSFSWLQLTMNGTPITVLQLAATIASKLVSADVLYHRTIAAQQNHQVPPPRPPRPNFDNNRNNRPPPNFVIPPPGYVPPPVNPDPLNLFENEEDNVSVASDDDTNSLREDVVTVEDLGPEDDIPEINQQSWLGTTKCGIPFKQLYIHSTRLFEVKGVHQKVSQVSDVTDEFVDAVEDLSVPGVLNPVCFEFSEQMFATHCSAARIAYVNLSDIMSHPQFDSFRYLRVHCKEGVFPMTDFLAKMPEYRQPHLFYSIVHSFSVVHEKFRHAVEHALSVSVNCCEDQGLFQHHISCWTVVDGLSKVTDNAFDWYKNQTIMSWINLKVKFRQWMSWSIVYSSNSWIFFKLGPVIVSPVARIVLSVAKLFGASSDTQELISLCFDMISGYVTSAVLTGALALLLFALSRSYYRLKLMVAGFSWSDVDIVFSNFTAEEVREYRSTDTGRFDLLRPPPNLSHRTVVHHNGVACLCGLPMWDFRDGKWITVRSVKEITCLQTIEADQSEVVTDLVIEKMSLAAESTADLNECVQTRKIILPAHVVCESSSDQVKTREKKSLPKNVVLETSGDQKVRKENKLLPKAVVLETSSDQNVRKDQRVLPKNVILESSSDQIVRQSKRKLPANVTLEALEHHIPRFDEIEMLSNSTVPAGSEKFVATPSLKHFIQNADAVNPVKIVAEGRFSPTAKLQTSESSARCKEAIQEYLSLHSRRQHTIPSPPNTKAVVFSDTMDPIDIATEACIDSNTVDVMRKIQTGNTVFVKNVDSKAACHAIISGTLMLFPCHLAKKGDEIEVYDKSVSQKGSKHMFNVFVSASVPDWDLACARVPDVHKRKNIDHLFVSDNQFFSSLTRTYLQYYPQSQIYSVVAGSFRESVPVRLNGKVMNYHDVIVVNGFETSGVLSRAGDCGGLLGYLNPTAPRKLCGMHISGAANGSSAFITILTQDRIDFFRSGTGELVIKNQSMCDIPVCDVVQQSMDHVLEGVSFAPVSELNYNLNFLLPQEEWEAQHFAGGSLRYVGDLVLTAKPVGEETELRETPFGMPFPAIKKFPSVLTENDCRLKDTSVLKTDCFDFPSILITQISKYSGPAVDVDCDLLSSMVDQLVDHYSLILKDAPLGCSEDHLENVWLSLNGDSEDVDFKPLAFKASTGIPWTDLGASKKIQLLKPVSITRSGQKVDGYWFDDQNPLSCLLYDVFNHKLSCAIKGQRTHSIWKDCLKDELRSTEKIEQGKTRAFTSAPFESVLLMRYLFGRFKTYHMKSLFSLNHALGINPHSAQWSKLCSLLQQKGSKVVDGDFSSFDGSIPRQFMLAAGDVIIRTIEEVSHDGLELARRTMWSEIVDTLQVSWSTLYLKDHGNNSGQPLTTPTNCIVVFLLLWYAFCKTTGKTSLAEFLKYVFVVTFGDDNVSNVSDEIAHVFHPKVIQSQLSLLGMGFTTAAKSGDLAWQSIEEVSFLKRKFVPVSPSYVKAPIEKESILQCFNFSLLSAEDVQGWKTVIHEQLLEAALHSQRFFTSTREALRKSVKQLRDRQLRESLHVTLLFSYEDACAILKARQGSVLPL